MMNPNWDLSYIYSDYNDPAITQDLADIKKLSSEIIRLTQSAEQPLTVLEKTCEKTELLAENSEKLSLFSSLPMAVDANNTDAALLMAKLDALMTDYSLAVSALTRYVGKLSNLDELIASSA